MSHSATDVPGWPQHFLRRLRSNASRLSRLIRDSTNLGPVLLAVVVGLAGGAGAIGFRWLISWSHELFFEGSARLVPRLGDVRLIFLPAAGLVLVSLIVRRWAPEARGHGVPEVQYAVRRLGGRIRIRVAAVKALASALCIGSGGSVGREGPIVQIGSTMGSAVGSLFGLREEGVKLLVACGAAAGIGGTFNAPIAGVMFSMEVILGTFTARSFGMVVLASVASTALVQSVVGRQPAFELGETFSLASPLELPFYLGLGVIAGVLAVIYIRTLYGLERAFARAPGSPLLKAAGGGLAIGLIGYGSVLYLGGPHIFGIGYETIEQALSLGGGPGAHAAASLTFGSLACLAGLKIFATSLTLAAGGSGGVFAPALFIGAMAGGAFGLAAGALAPSLTAPAGAYALVGMGAVFAGAAHAPITSILILFEMTDDYQIILPLMLAVVVSHLIASWLNPDSIYTIKLRHLGGTTPLQAARGSVLDLVLVVDAMSTDVRSVSPEIPVLELASRFGDETLRSLPVVEEDGSLVGLVTASDVQSALLYGDADAETANDIMTTNVTTCRPDESLRAVLQRIGDQEVSQVPVVDPEDPSRLLGLLRREQILWALGEMTSEHSRLLDRVGLAASSAEDSTQISLEVRPEHRELCFKRLRELELPEQCLVTILRRGERAIVPNGDTVIEPGDVLAVVTTQSHEGRVRDWINQLDQS
ncbi:MAG: chloride channel protein [Myxococcota bacterium]